MSLQQRHIVSLQQRHIVPLDDIFNVFGAKWVEKTDLIMKLGLPARTGLPHLSEAFPELQAIVFDKHWGVYIPNSRYAALAADMLRDK